MVPAAHVHRALAWAALCATLAAMSGCGSAPPRGGSAVVVRPGPASPFERDGADAHPPTDLDSVPNAQPQPEAIRKGGPNKPYAALGREYVPIADDRPFAERGLASWYGRKFHGHRTSSGEPYDMYAMTAAHPTLPIPSYVRVRNPANGREVIVRINDRGPFHAGRVIDLSYAAAYKLDLLKGVAPIELTRITFDEIRAGTWRSHGPSPGLEPDRDATAVAAVPALAPVPRDEPPAAAAVSVSAANAAGSAGDAAAEVRPSESSSISPAPIDTASSTARPTAGFWVQIGVFRQREGADGFSRRIAADFDWLAPLLAVFGEPSMYRLQAGPYASRDEAQGVAARVRESLHLVPVIVEHR